jgi:hypothetical protein
MQLLVPVSDPRMVLLLAKTRDNPRHRLQAVGKLCSTVKVCQGAPTAEDGGEHTQLDENGDPISNAVKHSGCGKNQPRFSRSREEVGGGEGAPLCVMCPSPGVLNCFLWLQGNTLEIIAEWAKQEGSQEKKV